MRLRVAVRLSKLVAWLRLCAKTLARGRGDKGKGVQTPFKMQGRRIAGPHACIGRCLHLDNAFTLGLLPRPFLCTPLLSGELAARNAARAVQLRGTPAWEQTG